MIFEDQFVNNSWRTHATNEIYNVSLIDSQILVNTEEHFVEYAC